MNFGAPGIKSVNTSKPQLQHASSERSIAASDNFHSFSDHEQGIQRDQSSSDERTTVIRYKTPPSHLRSEGQPRILESAERSTLPSREAVAPTNKSTAGHASAEKRSLPLSPKAVYMATWRGTRDENSPPTPEADDTPYIQFAIDQLTRDEELLGRSRDGIYSEDVAPVIGERLYSLDDSITDGLPGTSRPINPPRRSLGTVSLRGRPATPNILVPAYRPHDKYRFPVLDYTPGAIHLLPLAILIIVCLLNWVGLIVACVYSSKHDGLLPYDGVDTSRYFLFKFFPQSYAAFIILWLLFIQSAVQRILPFILLTKLTAHDVMHDVPMFVTNYLIPNLTYFKHGESLLGMCFVIFWMCLFVVPLQSCVFQTRLYLYSQQGIWMWTVVQPIAWVLIILYSLLMVALLALVVRFLRRRTGLKWDPVSLADLFVILRRTNVASRFENPGKNLTGGARTPRLGYWRTSQQPETIFYGVGQDGAPAPAEKAKMQPGKTQDPEDDVESQRPKPARRSLHRNPHSPFVRYRWIPWFLRDTWIVAWLVIALVLMMAFVAVSYAHHAIQAGFLPMLPSATTNLGFSASNFLYSFLPAFLGMILFLVWQPIDIYFRALEPFARLADPNGATADESLLLDYSSSLPIVASVKAATAGHFKVAWISFISVFSIFLPILAGGIWTAQWMVAKQQVLEEASLPAFTALVVFAIVYAFSLLIIWPTRKRYLPHDIRTLGNIFGFVYQSPVLEDAAFREPRSKADLVTRLMTASTGKGEVRYNFGVFKGKDGREWLGIDRLRSEARRDTRAAQR